MSNLIINTNLQYKTKEQLLKDLPNEIIDFPVTDLIKTDTYHEQKLIETFKLYKPDIQKQLMKCAIHIALIGAGRKNYGKIVDNGIEQNINDIFKQTKIRHENDQNTKLNENELTARRLVRLLRYQIQKYIITKNEKSYLFTKYSNHDENFRTICFPGAEHLIMTKKEADFLLQTYNKLDETLGTKFCQRLKLIFQAREIQYS